MARIGIVQLAAAAGLLCMATQPVRAAVAADDRRTGTAAAQSAHPKSTDPVEQKLDQILQNQQEILQRFDAIMEELRIIKIRATIN